MPVQDLRLTSPDIAHGERIGDVYVGQHGASAPEMVVDGVPDGAVELALICHDPDAPMPHGFTHWTLYGLDATDGPIPADAGRPGPNDDDGMGYVGPFPPPGHGTHHYFFWVYALSRPVEGQPTRGEFLDQYADAVIEQARLVGTFSR
ncbi:YbhB/YbcL family Raf kinase inhibitor-like protein [Demequina sp. NBRC 110053]|uniref:YbhB/YbcL family Raf kinase inhibitor-like protein n=1 Tax=Demequina sp. NBRC 110053 TaxID=1570342 RepID=UPI0009FD90AD|nr:YbhB/YbcL family Raf kinase inhibitor-like protein [Demequina sp. NBRC 110053]